MAASELYHAFCAWNDEDGTRRTALPAHLHDWLQQADAGLGHRFPKGAAGGDLQVAISVSALSLKRQRSDKRAEAARGECNGSAS